MVENWQDIAYGPDGIGSLDLSVRAFNALVNHDDTVLTISKLTEFTAARLMRIRGIGLISVAEISVALERIGKQLSRRNERFCGGANLECAVNRIRRELGVKAPGPEFLSEERVRAIIREEIQEWESKICRAQGFAREAAIANLALSDPVW